MLVPSNHEMLKTKLEDFDFTNPPIDPAVLVEQLVVECMKYDGLAISANQIGLPYRCFVMVIPGNEANGAKDMIIPVFNCKIVGTSENMVLDKEGCLSYPGLFLKIKRPEWVRARITDIEGNVTTERFTGITARIIQHECDHMDGIVFTSKTSKIHLTKAKKQVKINNRRRVA